MALNGSAWPEEDVPEQITSGLWPASNDRGYTIFEHPAKTGRRMKVIAVGGGISGITLARQVKASYPNFQLKVFEVAKQPGGVWLWNRYPGVACDNAGLTYQYMDRVKPDWNNFYSTGQDICKYLQDVYREEELDAYFTFETEVTSAVWSEERSTWSISLKGLGTSQTWQEDCDVFINCIGSLATPKWPNLKGLSNYKGILVHSARYPEGLELSGKTVAVLGTGSSGIQIVPASLLQGAACVHHWIRQPTWIIPQGSTRTNFAYSEEQKERFKSEELYYKTYRKALEHLANENYQRFIKGSKENIALTEACTQSMAAKLQLRPTVAEALIPKTFPVGCRRPTPGPGYLEALCDDRVTVHLGEMQGMTEKGFIDASGTEHAVDVFICATGFDTSYIPRFPIIAKNIDLRDKWADEPTSYLSYAVDGFPNYFTTWGPFGATAHGSAFPVLQILISKMLSLVQKMSEEQIASMMPTTAAVDDYMEHCALYLRRTVWMGDCRSWWKKGNDGVPRVFPGSRIAFLDLLEDKRNEDWTYRYFSNRYRFLGNGQSKKEFDGSDLSWYMGTVDEKLFNRYDQIVVENLPRDVAECVTLKAAATGIV